MAWSREGEKAIRGVCVETGGAGECFGQDVHQRVEFGVVDLQDVRALEQQREPERVERAIYVIADMDAGDSS